VFQDKADIFEALVYALKSHGTFTVYLKGYWIKLLTQKRVIKLFINNYKKNLQTISCAKIMNNYTKATLQKRTILRRPKTSQLCDHILIPLYGCRTN